MMTRFLSTILLVIPTCATAAVEVAYDDEHDRQKLDIYAVEGGEDLPVMIFVHGGGWRIGNKRAVQSKPEFFNNNGWVFVSINYRLLPEGQHPNNVEDVAAAIAWVHRNIADYGGDPDRIVIMGHSAGAHLVSLVSTDDRKLAAHNLDLSVIKGCIELDTAALDLIKLTSERRGGRFYRNVFGEDENVLADASPITHIEPGKNIPPFLLVVADGNERKRDQAETFAERLEAAGVQSQTADLPNFTHGTVNRTIGEPNSEITTIVYEFAQRVISEE